VASTSAGRYGAVWLLVICLLLAGCQGLVGVDERSSDTPTVTPAVVPDQASEAFSAEGVDAGRLAELHRQALVRTNYTLTLSERLVIDGDPRRVTTRRRQVGAEARAYGITRTERTENFAPSNYAGIEGYWYNGSTELIRYPRSAGQRYEEVENPSQGLLTDPTEHRTIEGMVSAFDTKAGTRERLPNGSYLVRTGELSRADRIPGLGYFVDPRNATLSLVVNPRGFVERYRVSYSATIAGTDRQVEVSRELKVTRVGRTAVRPPAWAGAGQSGNGTD